MRKKEWFRPWPRLLSIDGVGERQSRSDGGVRRAGASGSGGGGETAGDGRSRRRSVGGKGFVCGPGPRRFRGGGLPGLERGEVVRPDRLQDLLAAVGVE